MWKNVREPGGVGGGVLLLLFIGIHNAWDNVAYHVLVNIANAHRVRNQEDVESMRHR